MPDEIIKKADVANLVVSSEQKIKPFPYYPSQIPLEEMKRMELMMELNKWSHNDEYMAKRAAETLIYLLADQFNIDLKTLICKG